MTVLHTGIWGQTLVTALRKHGVPSAAIAGNTGIILSALNGDDPKISFDKLALLFERAAELTSDDLIGFKHGQNRDFRLGGLFSYTGMSSPTVGSLFHNLARFQRLRGNAVEINVSRLDTEGISEWHYQVQRGVSRRQYLEFDGTGIIDLIRGLTNRRVTPEKVEFRHFRNKNTKPIEKFFGCSVVFGSDENRITLKTTDLDLPLNTADDLLYQLLRKYSEEALPDPANNKSSLLVALEHCIAAKPTATQAEVAASLGLSPRTLARRLTDAGTTFSSVVETYREAMAKSMLTNADLQLTEIAYVLGYADLSSFSTAFKRWVGITPSQYRDRNS